MTGEFQFSQGGKEVYRTECLIEQGEGRETCQPVRIGRIVEP